MYKQQPQTDQNAIKQSHISEETISETMEVLDEKQKLKLCFSRELLRNCSISSCRQMTEMSETLLSSKSKHTVV